MCIRDSRWELEYESGVAFVISGDPSVYPTPDTVLLVKQGILKTLGLYRATMTNTHGEFLFFNFLVFRKPMLNRVA